MIRLYKCGQTSNDDICVTSSSPEQPETLASFICGEHNDPKECAFDVDATFKFKQPIAAKEMKFSQKFEFALTKNYTGYGYRNFAKIDVIFNLLFLSTFFDDKF